MPAADKITIKTLQDKVKDGQRISMLALYDYPFAVLAKEAGLDSILVGDSAAMVNYGHQTTLPADMDMMIRHTQSVKRGAPDLFIIGDMPYAGENPKTQTILENARRFIEEGQADAVKLEGGTAILETVKTLVKENITVVGHLGLLPQTAALTGEFKSQGTLAAAAIEILQQAKQLEEAGVSMLVLECIPPKVAEAITQQISIPVIGIGSGASCNGQVLILFDILGIYPRFTPKFVRHYANLAAPITNAIKQYKTEVEQGEFPTPDHCYKMKPGEAEIFQEKLNKLKNLES